MPSSSTPIKKTTTLTNTAVHEKPFTLTIHHHQVFTLRPIHESNLLQFRKPFERAEAIHLKQKKMYTRMLALNERQKQTVQKLESYVELQTDFPSMPLLYTSTHPEDTLDGSRDTSMPMRTPGTRSFRGMDTNAYLGNHHTMAASAPPSMGDFCKSVLAPICEGTDTSQWEPQFHVTAAVPKRSGDVVQVVPPPSPPPMSRIYFTMDELVGDPSAKIVAVSNHLRSRVWKPYFAIAPHR